MDLRQFRNIAAVIEKGSLGRAAEALHISQPALTKSIQRLEQQLGVPLFYRDARGMHPTIYGECLRAHAQAVSVGVKQALAEVEALKDGTKGVLTIAAPPLIANQILVEAVISVGKASPGLQIRVRTTAMDPRPDLLAGDYDFVINVLKGQTPGSGLTQRLLFNDRLVVVAHPDHPLTRLPQVTARDLGDADWVLPPLGNYHRQRLESLFEAEGLPPPQASIECSSTPFIMSIASQSDRVGLVAKVAVEEQRPADLRGLAVIEIESPFMVRPIGIIWREHHVLSPASRLLIAAIEQVCRER